MSKEFGQTLREKRLAYGKTILEMAQVFSVSKPTWATWELGTREPNLTTLREICLFLNVSADELIGLTDSKQPSVTAVKSSVAIGAGAVAGAVAGNCANCPLMLAASKVVSGKRK